MKEIEIFKKKFPFYGIATMIYAVFYTFCLYKNVSGITAPFFAAGTLFYFCLCIKKLGRSLKKDSIFYGAAIMLLAVSLFLTDNYKIIFMNYLVIFVLFLSFMLHQFYADEKWSFEKQGTAIGGILLDALTCIGNPFLHAKEFYRNYKKGADSEKSCSVVKNIGVGIAITLPLIIIILVLLMSADRIFENFVSEIIKRILFHWNLIEILIMLLFAFFASYAFLAALVKGNIKEEQEKKKKEALIAITFTSALSVLYLLFSGVQISGLFLKQMRIPGSFSYAEYARDGFFQLLLVCIINVILVLICLSRFKENKALKGLLSIISACTFVMIASSAYRMLLYISVYQLTFLRIFVLWALLVIALLMAGIVITIFKKSFPLFRYGMIVVVTLYTVFSFSRPDYYIAKNTTDYDYLSTLSADAAPVLIPLIENQAAGLESDEQQALYRYQRKQGTNYQEMTFRTFNVSRFAAGRTAGYFRLDTGK